MVVGVDAADLETVHHAERSDDVLTTPSSCAAEHAVMMVAKATRSLTRNRGDTG